MLAGALGAAATAAAFWVSEGALQDSRPDALGEGVPAETASTANSAGSEPQGAADTTYADWAAELARLSEQLQAERSARENLARRLSAAERRMQPMADAPTPTSDADGDLIDAEVAPERVAMSLDDAFAAEPRDDGWALETEDALYRKLSAPDIGVSGLAMVECRTSLCTIEGLHEDNGAQQRFMEEFPMMLDGMSGYVQTDRAADGSPITRVYLARSGFGLPDIP